MAISQSLSDFKDLPGIMNNLGFFIGLRSEKEERDLWQESFGFPDGIKALAADAKSIMKRYSEALLILKEGDGWIGNLVSIHPTTRDYYSFTTDEQDLIRLKHAIEEFGSLDDALKQLDLAKDLL